MAPDLTTEAWAQIRRDYEHSDKPIDDICAEHGISPNTLRDRRRRWGWAQRRPPISAEGPPPLPAPARAFDVAAPSLAEAIETATPPLPSAHAPGPAESSASDESSLHPAAPPSPGGDSADAPTLAPAPPDDGAIVARLQGAVARVLPAIETIVTRLAAGPTPPRELERAARALSSLTRTLRELNGLLDHHQAHATAIDDDPIPEDIDEFRRELARRMRAFVDARQAKSDGGAEPQDV
jgi:transposase-like protein